MKESETRPRARVGSDRVGPDDPRCGDLLRRGFNKRFAGKPDYVRLVGSTGQVVDAVQDAVRAAEAEPLFDEYLAAINDGVGVPFTREVEKRSWLAFAIDPFGALAWVRAFYRELFADSGGVPVPGEVCDGAMINHPDVDLADPEWNTSGVPWSALYYKDNYPRLQRVKARWDPRNVFHHALSIRPPQGVRP